MLALIDPADAHDPIAAQFVPTVHELDIKPNELIDPIGDHAHSPVAGIVHRYPDRCLLKLLLTCPVYCRFCFRREQVGQGDGLLSEAALESAFAYIESHPELWEVILTGGDPLILSPRRLGTVIARLNAIPHVKIIRIHSRVPVVSPALIDADMLAALNSEKPVYLLLHCNHARELTAEARAACTRLARAGIPLLSQSVLLRGINDTAETLTALMRALVEARVKPHYLHHLDLAAGTSHFRVPLAEGQALLKGLRGTVSGLCQPSYILDIPGGHGKVPVGPVHAIDNEGGWMVEDFNGGLHSYCEVC
jgi:lysine 2,3-aminomutase